MGTPSLVVLACAVALLTSGCRDRSRAGGSPSLPSAAESARSEAAPTVAQLRASKPVLNSVHRVRGWVVKKFSCPPCPPGSNCKPCEDYAVLSDDSTLQGSGKLDDRDAMLFGSSSAGLELGRLVTVVVRARTTGPDGMLYLELVDGAR